MGTLPDVKEKVGREETEVAGVAHSPWNLAGAKRGGRGSEVWEGP